MNANRSGRSSSPKNRSVRMRNTKPERLMQRALDRKNDNDISGAIEILVKLTEEFNEYAPAFQLVAGLYWQTKQLEKAIVFGKRAIGLLPKSELASKILFQAYLDSGDREAAIEELKRFIQIGKSEHYSIFLKDLAEQESDSKRRNSLLRLADKMAR